ncbi:MAG: GPR endopeptidase [Firmicutes bacterium]|nr:GPR endopeptidase [Alicyclobacillaceae bacterium]MCL6496397.1 GPR endopeptidase [Bacillota bacterium]
MAVEARDLVRGAAHEEVPGVTVSHSEEAGVHVTVVTVESEEGARLMGKPRGRYLTLDVPAFRDRPDEVKPSLIAVLSRKLRTLFPQAVDRTVLVVGLGNRQATPDAVGPRTVERLLVTRHLQGWVDSDLSRRMRPVAAIAPGVLGTTGVETLDIVRGLVTQIAPDLVVAIDALAARNLRRLLASVQIADTGIHPGGGVGNHRQGLTAETVGVPVVAVGVCTVVQATSIVGDALELLAQAEGAPWQEAAHRWSEAGRRRAWDAVLAPIFGTLMVTPKEVDQLVDTMADVLAESLNRSLQPQLRREEWT